MDDETVEIVVMRFQWDFRVAKDYGRVYLLNRKWDRPQE